VNAPLLEQTLRLAVAQVLPVALAAGGAALVAGVVAHRVGLTDPTLVLLARAAAVLALPGIALLGAAGQTAATLQVPRGGALPLLLAVACVAGGMLAGVHRPALLASRELLVLWPVGAPAQWLPALPALLAWLVAAAHACLVLALTLATPVLLTAATLDLGLRLACRGVAVPLGEALRPWLCAAAGLVALGAAWAAYPEAWLRAWPGVP